MTEDRQLNPEELQVEFSNFTGPLDILLKLVQEGKLEIKNFSMTNLAEQYLSYIAVLGQHKIDLAFEYLYMAVYLTWLKSKLLLPKEELDPEEQEDITNAEEYLRLRLEYMHKLKLGFKHLSEQAKIDNEYYLRDPANFETDDFEQQIEELRPKQFDVRLEDLCVVISDIFLSNQLGKPLIIKEDKIYISTKRAFDYLLEMVPKLKDWHKLDEMIVPEAINRRGIITKSSKATLLLAALELSKLNQLEIRQNKHYGETYIRKV